ncbi:uncharacterized protein [Euphorbia lathyris]|uniref:uncharacterized protein isoform X2 n=1 Tax=Euphorbia lathyris TaxID=212925 RepID=UPI003313B97B
MPMAADHRRKRLNGASFAGCSSWEQYKTKKKKLESPKCEFNARSHISLEWDGSLKKVVAKREQIGLRRKDLRAFNNLAPQCHGILADVLVIPQEIFEVENLMEVLSHEVWQTHLSENERKYLSQFLPRGSDGEDTVQALLSGDNFHFGNPFLKWGTSLCSGNLHPDSLIHQEQWTKSEQKSYFSEIDKYHNDMVKYLQKLKEICENSQDPANEVLKKISRSRRDVEQQISSHANEFGLHNLEENAATTSESCSFIAEDKACSSDNQNSSLMKGGKIQRRVHEKCSTKDTSRKQLLASDDGKPTKGELQKRNIHLNDGDNKYMSYLKISKKQHQLVKSMKHSGKSIQSKSLNRVLGNLDMLHVQPYGEFVKEEQKKLQAHWLQLANVDLPAAYENWRARQSQRKEITKSLEQDLKSKLETLMEDDETVSREQHEGVRKLEFGVKDEEKVNYMSILQYQNDQGKRKDGSDEDEEISGDEDVLEDQIDLGEREFDSNFEVLLYLIMFPFSLDEEKECHDTVLLRDQNDGPGNKESYVEDGEDSGSGSPQYLSPEQIASPSACHEINPSDADSEKNHVASKSDEVSPNNSGYSGNGNTADPSVGQGGPIPIGGDVWPTVGMPHSFYGSTTNNEYASIGELSLPHSVNNAQRSQVIDLESDVHEVESAKILLQRQANDGSFSYPNHDRSGLLQSLFKGQDMVSYQHEQKQMGLDFQSHNMLIQDGHFSGQLQRQLHPSLPLEQGQKRHGENYMQQSLSENIYSEGGQYLVPRQGHVPPINGHVPPVNLPDWPVVNPVRMPARLPAHLNNDVLITQNWYSSEHQVRGGWNSTESASVPGQSISSNTDQGLYSVFSQCSQLRSNNHFDMVPPEQFMLPARSYEMASGVTSRIGNSLPQAAHPLDYLSGRDTTGSLMPDDMGWMHLPQNSGLHDSVGKSYLRSWNQ